MITSRHLLPIVCCAIALSCSNPPRSEEVAPPAAGRRLLVLGGTNFIGPHLVPAAQKAGFEVTIFTRGKNNPDLFEGVEKLRGDRDPEVGDGIKALAPLIEDNENAVRTALDSWRTLPPGREANSTHCEQVAERGAAQPPETACRMRSVSPSVTAGSLSASVRSSFSFQ
jgi:hypothetical protein